ncbi:gamma-glutamylcyclotransferase-like [Mizuhopecten yessoensis]|uniref:gamma-glutamylcyclotransferase n=1 Tax=Mizuhopecten yessoensis TaxID=6573 RepID=A0A210PN68_MIZYE|nr:gamma-glutamylcyclotransferase-like [Mizuhopecten yessoensis]XP_021379308.1 gamma-glutamylcyclotransferase-like [Mizuhopecten yessoensis]OWF37949.1 Gamma-glutamylcyclotransferase [Mizuhopecten yessoensis]
MSAHTFTYFAYGSNLLKERLLLRNPTAEFKSIASLKDYRLKFEAIQDPDNSRWHGSIATIEEQTGANVWGAVWELDLKDLPNLDKQEGIYRGFDVKVVYPEGQEVVCRTYKLDKTGNPAYDSRPSPHYKDVILRGAKGLQLPHDYLNFLQNIPDNGYQGSVKVYEDVLKMLGETK